MKKIVLLATSLIGIFWPQGGNASIHLTATPERKILSASADDCLLQIELEGEKKTSEKRRMPLNIAVVLDRSGSMSGAKIEKARQAACLVVEQLGKDDRFSFVVYDNEVDVVIPSTKVSDKEALQRKIQRIETRGSTALYAGVKSGSEEVRKFFDAKNINRVLLLSDGLANVGPQTPTELAQLGRRIEKDGISVSTIGLGDDFNEDLMTALAESAAGNYYYVQDAEKLPGIFAEELGAVKSIVARNIKLKIILPDGVKAKGVLGEDDIRIQDDTVIIPLKEFVSAQKRRFLLDCHVPAGEMTQLAQIKLEYTDSESGDIRHEDVAVNAERTSDLKKSEASVQANVLSNAAVTRNRLAKEKAVALADAGKPKAAADVLRQQAKINESLPTSVQNELLRSEQRNLENHAASLEASGKLDKAARKGLTYENYQDKKQKR